MASATMRELLEAGVHFGHQTRRWNPKMRRYIFAERSGIYIIDLQKSLQLLEQAHDRARSIAERGGTVLFVGTKKQARDAVRDQATRAGQPFVNHRWLGGLLTNFRTISDRIAYLHELRRQQNDGQLALLPTKERMTKLSELEKLETNLGGVAEMRRLPSAVFVIDLKAEALAVREARRLGIPLIGLVDTNCDPDEVDMVVPGNDDAIRACALICRVLADGVVEGRGVAQAAQAAEEEGAEDAVEEAVAEALAVAGLGEGAPAAEAAAPAAASPAAAEAAAPAAAAPAAPAAAEAAPPPAAAAPAAPTAEPEPSVAAPEPEPAAEPEASEPEAAAPVAEPEPAVPQAPAAEAAEAEPAEAAPAAQDDATTEVER